MNELFQLNADAVQNGLIFIGILVNAGIAITIHRSTKRISQLQFNRSVFDAWMNLDSFLLTHPSLIEKYRDIVIPKSLGNPSDDKKFLLSFMILNPLNSIYQGYKNKYVDEESLKKIDPLLSSLMVNDELYTITQNYLFENGFAEYCKKIKEKKI